VHIHAETPGPVLDKACSFGVLSDIKIENMDAQHAGLQRAENAKDTVVVAVAMGEGLERIFHSLGCDEVVRGGQTMNPSTQDLVQAVDSLPNDQVIILPNNSNIVLAANQAQELAEKNVDVVATKTVPQGIAALLAFSYQGDLETNRASMASACRQVETLEVTQAVRDAQVNGLEIAQGQFIGLLNGDLVTVDAGLEVVVKNLLDSIDMDDMEIVTIYYGADVNEDQAAEIAELIEGSHPDVEVEVIDGGQAHYFYIISAE